METNYVPATYTTTGMDIEVLSSNRRWPLAISARGTEISSHGVVVTALALHAGDPGSIPGGVKKFVSSK
ncbi:hypothetical protein M8J77_002667 [Diaphorina citri]|nr:hypothetical protein M8J77_002667 [Diaphorina citri]